MQEPLDISPEDAKKIAPYILGFFGSLYAVALLLNVAMIGLLIYAGWRGWAWWLVLPGGAAIWFALRVGRRWARNLFTGSWEDLRIAQGLPPENKSQEVAPTNSRPTVAQRLSDEASIVIVSGVMVAATALWYGIGALAQALR
jgi:hypothetical protein